MICQSVSHAGGRAVQKLLLGMDVPFVVETPMYPRNINCNKGDKVPIPRRGERVGCGLCQIIPFSIHSSSRACHCNLSYVETNLVQHHILFFPGDFRCADCFTTHCCRRPRFNMILACSLGRDIGTNVSYQKLSASSSYSRS